MATTTIELAVGKREKTGTTAAHASRHAGKVPGILYGHGSEPLAIELDAKRFDEILHKGGKNALLDITVDGGRRDTALVRDVQRDPLTRRVIHADLQRVSATEEISASLPIVAVGVADGVKNSGGVLDTVLHSIDVKGPANELPEHIEVDVTALVVGSHLTAGDIRLPGKLRLDMDAHTIVMSLEASKTEAEAADAAPVAVDAAVPTVAETAAASE